MHVFLVLSSSKNCLPAFFKGDDIFASLLYSRILSVVKILDKCLVARLETRQFVLTSQVHGKANSC